MALDRPTALKLISGDEPSTTLRARFLVEARALARLQHPNVVGVYRFGEVEGRPYLAYEFVEGGVLSGGERLPWQRALSVGLQVARGMAAAHERGVVHRDIKPANIMLGVDGTAKLLDFGLAVLGGGADSSAQPLTLDGRVVGTPAYMAPERWLGEPPSPQGDVWAWALVLRQMLCGAHPLEGMPATELPRRLTLDELPPTSAEAPQVPPVLCSFVDRCLARSPERRPPSGVEVRDALEAVQAMLAPVGLDHGGEGRIGLVMASFARIQSSLDLFVRRFYERIFALSPGLRPLFPVELTGQREKLGGALQLAVQSLRMPDVLGPVQRDMGRRHAAYGVEPRHFEPVGAALMSALAESEGAAWTPELHAAWASTWGELARAMLAGLAEARNGDTLGLLTEGSAAISKAALPVYRPPAGPTPSASRSGPGPRGASTTPPRAAGSAAPPLPSPLTRFHGRSLELEALLGHVQNGVRLLTVLGMGGAGKSRLALELARRVNSQSLGRPVHWAPLGETRERDAALVQILKSMGHRETRAEPLELLISLLEQRPAVLFLDNAEDAADELAEDLASLLEQCPDTTCIVTSQQPLHLMGELLFRLEPLPLPSPGAGVAELEACDALQLLLDRIRLQRPSFKSDPQVSGQLMALARKLDGIPLALELAAVRVGTLTVPALVERLEKDLSVIEEGARGRGGRQRNLTSSLRRTQGRLAPELKRLFLDLSVFPEDFDLEDVEDVLGERPAEGTMEELLDLSLVLRAGEGRWRLLRTVRAFALRSSEPQRVVELKERLEQHIRTLATDWSFSLGGSEAVRLTERLKQSWTGLLAVVDQAPTETAAAILGRIPVFVLWNQRYDEVLPRMERLFAADLLASLSPDVLGGLARAAFRLHLVTGNRDRTEAWHIQLKHCATLPLSPRVRAAVEGELALAALERGRLREAERMYARLRDVFVQMGDIRSAAVHVDSLARCAHFQAEFWRARQLTDECAALLHTIGDPQLAEANLTFRAGIAAEDGSLEELRERVAHLRDLTQRQGRELTQPASRELDIQVLRLAGEQDRAWPLVLAHLEDLQGQPRLRSSVARLAALIALDREDWPAVAEWSEVAVQDMRQLDRRFLLPGPLFLRLLAWHRLGRAVEPALLREAAAAALEVDGNFATDLVLRTWSELRPQDGLGGRIPAGQWRQRLSEFLSNETPALEGEAAGPGPAGAD